MTDDLVAQNIEYFRQLSSTIELCVYSPHPESQHVRLIERALNLPQSAITVACHLPAEARELFCFENVMEQVAKHGGSIVYGWLVWQHGEMFIEAEHHGVWQQENGELVCVTPQNPPEVEITFVPDPSTVFDFETRQRTDNVRVGLFEDDALKMYFATSELLTLIHNRASKAHWPQVTMRPEDYELFAQSTYLKPAHFGLAWSNRLATLGRNDLCLCGFGKKFKKCHGNA